MVREQDDHAAIDDCHFSGSTIPKVTGITGGTWTVENGNVWRHDFIGGGTGFVNYYRTERTARGLPLPCRIALFQNMEINCPSSWNFYRFNQLFFDIGVTYVISSRGGINAQRNWP
jgi:hypothetical protein